MGFLFAHPLPSRYFQLGIIRLKPGGIRGLVSHLQNPCAVALFPAKDHNIKTRWGTRIGATLSHLQNPCASDSTSFLLEKLIILQILNILSQIIIL